MNIYEASSEGGWSLVRDTRDGEIVATFRHNAVKLPGTPAAFAAEFVHARAVADAQARDQAAKRERELLRQIVGADVDAADHVLTAGSLLIDMRTCRVTSAGNEISLSATEYALLVALARDPDRLYTKGELLQSVWGYPPTSRSRTLDSHACRLRKALNAATGERYVDNVWGRGYRLVNKPAATEVREAA